jgi:hypothetical protein
MTSGKPKDLLTYSMLACTMARSFIGILQNNTTRQGGAQRRPIWQVDEIAAINNNNSKGHDKCRATAKCRKCLVKTMINLSSMNSL